MRLGFGITQEQTQKLVMTPELRLAIRVLQLSTVELTEYIEEQLVENPVLDVVEDSAVTDGDDSSISLNEREADKFDIDWEQYFDDAAEADFRKMPVTGQEEIRYENFIAEAPNLQDYLMFQLALAGLNKEERNVGEFFIGNIDDNGYLHCPLDEASVKCGVALSTAQKVLGIIQGFDPPGVGAATIEECLLHQYEHLRMANPLLKDIIKNHLQEIADGKILKVSKKLGVTLREIQDAVDLLRLLDPKPGRKFSVSGNIRYIVPDIVVEKVGDEFIVLVNDVTAPRLTVNPVYKEMTRGNVPDQESRKYLETKLNSAVWLIKSIEQRRLTLYKVARCIVDFQLEFLEKGIKYLKPLNLKEVADNIGVHESTVSRATANKYMQTPRGLFEVKFFFSSGVSNTHGTATSSETVKTVIRELVTSENPKKPLSDQKIADILQTRGVDISRRTVAKYRDEIGILSTSRRRRY